MDETHAYFVWISVLFCFCLICCCLILFFFTARICLIVSIVCDRSRCIQWCIESRHCIAFWGSGWTLIWAKTNQKRENNKTQSQHRFKSLEMKVESRNHLPSLPRYVFCFLPKIPFVVWTGQLHTAWCTHKVRTVCCVSFGRLLLFSHIPKIFKNFIEFIQTYILHTWRALSFYVIETILKHSCVFFLLLFIAFDRCNSALDSKIWILLDWLHGRSQNGVCGRFREFSSQLFFFLLSLQQLIRH